MKTEKINWGIIGCGDVTELKSGPAFNKVPASALVAVMRRDAAKAEDYARRHGVPVWYDNADNLINDPSVNAIYIATPPDSHEQYCLAAIDAGKPVYVEKPMALNAASAQKMMQYAKEKNVKLVVAHYRRAQPMFQTVKQLLLDKAIGEVTHVQLDFHAKQLPPEALLISKVAWRVDPAISGGGLFHDLAPHQLGIMLYFFGDPVEVTGHASNKGGRYAADDTVSASVLFDKDIRFDGNWNFNCMPGEEKDLCIISGTQGSLLFSVFGKQEIMLTQDGKETTIGFEPLAHVQQPMIAQVVQYFLGRSENPCPPEEGVEVMRLMDTITAS